MRLIRFDQGQILPVVNAIISGPRSYRKVRLVFDTGSGLTQIDTSFTEYIGYSAIDAEKIISVQGATGDSQEGYLLKIQNLSIFGLKYDNLKVGVYDFTNFQKYRINGLLGFDVIKQMHLELDGRSGTLKIFDK